METSTILILLYLGIGTIFSIELIQRIEEEDGEFKNEWIFPVFVLGLIWPIMIVLKATK